MFINHQLSYILTSQDIYLGFIYFFLILIVARYVGQKFYATNPIKFYILPALALKLIACVILALIFHFYYGYGDSFNYFTGATEIWSAFKDKPSYAVELIFKPISQCSGKAQSYAVHIDFVNWGDPTTYMFKISGFIGLFCFGSYLPIAMIFSAFSFYGLWKIFTVFYKEFPQYRKLIAVGTLLAPSALFWSTNIFKDPLCVFAIGILFNAVYSLFKKTNKLESLVSIPIGVVVLLALKSYLLFCFAGATLFTLFLSANFVVRNKNKRLSLNILTLIFLLLGIIYLSIHPTIFSDFYVETFKQQTDTIQEVATNSTIQSDGSGYVISGVDDLSLYGIMRSLILSTNVALFRPYFWESHNIMSILNALESFVVMIFFIWILIKAKFYLFFSILAKHPILQFAFFFTLILAPMVGFISFNFGTLVRYKVPLVPFFYTLLLLMNQLLNKLKRS